MQWLIRRDEYQALIGGAELLEWDPHGPKVWLLPNGRILKLFRIKRRLSGALFYPYSMRFARNARRLRQLGIATVEVERVAWCPAVRRHLVIYPKLEGEQLEGLFAGEDGELYLRQFATWMAHLHHLGVLFRGLHLGNILRLPDGELALIDVGDMSFRGRPLKPRERVRNFRHMLRRARHLALFQKLGLPVLLQAYLVAAGGESNGVEGMLRSALPGRPDQA